MASWPIHTTRIRPMYRSRWLPSNPGAAIGAISGAKTMTRTIATAMTRRAAVRIVRAKARAVASASPLRPRKSGRNGPMIPPVMRMSTGACVSEAAFQSASVSGPAPKTCPTTFLARNPEPALTTASTPRMTAPLGRASWTTFLSRSNKPRSSPGSPRSPESSR